MVPVYIVLHSEESMLISLLVEVSKPRKLLQTVNVLSLSIIVFVFCIGQIAEQSGAIV